MEEERGLMMQNFAQALRGKMCYVVMRCRDGSNSGGVSCFGDVVRLTMLLALSHVVMEIPG